MEANFEQVLDKVSQNIKEMVKTETIVVEEFQMGEFSCRPVIKVGMGFGGGSGKGDDPKGIHSGTGTGAGAGVGMSPVGFLVAKGTEISFIPATNKKGLSDLFDKVPDLLEKIIEMKHEKEKKESDKKQ
jgi:uncharacterized spore protein YtfJ